LGHSDVRAAVEGLVDEAIVRRLLDHVAIPLGPVYGKKGKSFLQQHICGYNNAARHAPWLVLIDLNHDAQCAPALRRSWVPCPATHMCFRIAVREIEAWLFGDPQRLSRFLAVPASRVPQDPESVERPKQQMVALARQSRRSAIRQDMVPREESGRMVGPAYVSRLSEFVGDAGRGWRPDVAAEHCPSLCRALKAIARTLARAAS
jgi:hypothetical protein